MKKSLFLLLLFFFSLNIFSQKDSIVNYLGYKNKVLKKVDKAYYIEIITKESDSLWKRRLFKRNGKLSSYRYYTSANKSKKNRIGQYVVYGKNDSVKKVSFYNRKGQKHGNFQSWFINNNKNIEGSYVKGKKEGVWRAYHYNGKIAVRSIFKNDSLIRGDYYNENGVKIKHDTLLCRGIKPKFKGGQKKFTKKLKQLTKEITYKVKGRVFVNFTVDINGDLKDIEVYDTIPLKLKKQIVRFFEKIKGWEPATHKHRRIPFNLTVPLNFQG